MKKLSNTEVDLKKSVAYKKACIYNHDKSSNVLWSKSRGCIVGYSIINGIDEPVTLLKVTLHQGCFPRFSNCRNGTKSRKTLHMKLWHFPGARANNNIKRVLERQLPYHSVYYSVGANDS